MKSRIFALLAVLALSASASAQEIAGDWSGTMQAFGAQMHMVVHIARSVDGTLHATVDSIEQNAYAIPVANVVLEAGQLVLQVESLNARYVGVLDPAAKKITGHWTQGPPLAGDWILESLDLERAPSGALPKPKPSALDGTWQGTVEYQGEKWQMTLRIFNTQYGLRASLVNAGQGEYGWPLGSVTCTGAKFSFKMESIDLEFSAVIAPDGESMDGRWPVEDDVSVPVHLTRVRSGTAPSEKQQ